MVILNFKKLQQLFTKVRQENTFKFIYISMTRYDLVLETFRDPNWTMRFNKFQIVKVQFEFFENSDEFSFPKITLLIEQIFWLERSTIYWNMILFPSAMKILIWCESSDENFTNCLFSVIYYRFFTTFRFLYTKCYRNSWDMRRKCFFIKK